jgi:CBS-domain-containing membrane protein
MTSVSAVTFSGLTVADAAITVPKTHPVAASVADINSFFADDHVHAALTVDQQRKLLSIVERADLQHVPSTSADRAAEYGQLYGRTTAPTAELSATYDLLLRTARRRLAVIDHEGRLLGLLCLKRTLNGFCSDRDVAHRPASERGRSYQI